MTKNTDISEPHIVLNGKPIWIPRDGLTIGRSADNSLPLLEDDQLSRNHAEIVWFEGGWAIRDLGSANGTFVNGERVAQQTLKADDEIRIGRTVLVYRAKTSK